MIRQLRCCRGIGSAHSLQWYHLFFVGCYLTITTVRCFVAFSLAPNLRINRWATADLSWECWAYETLRS